MIARPTYRFAAAVWVCVALLPAGTAAPHSLTVPFFRDDGGTMADSGPHDGAAALITVTNTRNTPVTMYLVYAQNDVDGGTLLQQAVPYTLTPKQVVRWRPVKDDPAEGSSRAVPNVLAGLGNFGSVVVYWTGGDETTGALVGQYREFSSRSTSMHVLLEQRN